MAKTKGFEFTAVPSMQRVAFALTEYADKIDDWSEPFRDIEKMFYLHERNLFRTSGTGRGSSKWPKWQKLSERYAIYKKRVRPGRPILTFYGALRKAATGGPGSIEGKVGKTSMLVGIDPGSQQGVIARAHTTGAPLRGLPSRPPVRFDGDVEKRGVSFGYAVSQIIQSYLVLKRKEAMRKDPEVLKRISFGKTAQHHKNRIEKIQRTPWR